MKRPSFQFYPADWQGNAKLRRCSPTERSLWLDVMCLMHDSEEYGVLRWPLKEIAQAIGCKVSVLRDLAQKGVLKGADPGQQIEAFDYTPRHAGKDGETVVLLVGQPGPVWYSSRMVRDEYVRSKRGEGTRFGSNGGSGGEELSTGGRVKTKGSTNHHTNPREGDRQSSSPSRSPIHREGDGASSSSTSKSSTGGEVQSPTRSLAGQGPLKNFVSSTTSDDIERNREIARKLVAGELKLP